MKHLKSALIVYCILLWSCDWAPFNHDDIYFHNECDSTIYVQFNIENDPLYYNKYHMDKFCVKVDAKQTTTLKPGGPMGWEELIASMPSKILTFFISDTMLYECELSNVETHILQRYNLTEQDLDKLNWTITYPSGEAMKNVKMYPPYKEYQPKRK